MAKKVKSIWGQILSALSSPFIRDKIVQYLEKEITKAILKKLVIASGFKAWLITFVVGELIELGDDKALKPIFRKIGYVGDVEDGKYVYRKIQDVQIRDEWRSTIGNA